MTEKKETTDKIKDKAVEVEKKKPSRAKKADAPESVEVEVSTEEMDSAKKVQRRSGKVTGIADVSAALKKTDSTVSGGKAVQGQRSHIDALNRARATGRRKVSTARIIMKRGSGRITVNGRTQEEYFARPVLRMMISQPFAVTERLGQYDVIVNVNGGGLSGQAGAVRHGISRALTYLEPELRSVLKKLGFLTRDSRTVERKKYGQPKARRRFQFSKR